jgi:hypothetical protein
LSALLFSTDPAWLFVLPVTLSEFLQNSILGVDVNDTTRLAVLRILEQLAAVFVQGSVQESSCDSGCRPGAFTDRIRSRNIPPRAAMDGVFAAGTRAATVFNLNPPSAGTSAGAKICLR